MAFSNKLPRFMLVLSAATLTAALPAAAQEVTLRGKDSPLNITGTLLSSDSGRFVVRTAIGEFEIEQSLVTCEGAPCPQVRDITYDLNLVGEGDVAEVLIPIIAEGFATTLDAETILLDANGNPIDLEVAGANLSAGGKIDIEIVGYDGEEIANFGVLEGEGMPAYEMLVSGEAPIMFADIRASRHERDFVKDSGAGDLTSFDQDRVIAVEGFAVVVNPKNNLGAVSLEQVADIFAGRVTNWSQLGGDPGPINLYSYDSDSESFNAISELVLEPFDYTLSPDANIVRNAGELTTAITRDEAGFGIVNYHSRRGTRALPLTNECGITFYISPFNIKTEEYPLSHRVHVYNRANPEGFAADFLEYLAGSHIDGLVSQAGFVDLTPVSEIQVESAERVAAAAANVSDPYERGFMDTLVQKQNEYERLSTTFRFAPGSDDLDNKGRRDLARMINFITQRKPQEVIAVGFTDNKGTFDANLLLSEQVAASVLAQIQDAATADALQGISFSALGFGELSPAGCNSSPFGRAKNRRVEIWIR